MEKLRVLALALMMLVINLVGINPAAADSTFSCGSDGTYSVSTAGVLTYGNCDADSLVLDSSVVSIQYASMQGWQIKSLTIPSSVTTIGNSAFYALPNLETITVNASNTNFKTVNGVLMDAAETRIIHYPGANRSTTYTVPGSVTSIDDRSFNCLSYLEVVNIPATTTSIGPSAFETCGYATPSLKEINISVSNPQYSSIGNVLFSKDGTTLLNFPGNYAQPDYDVPAGTVTISASAFAYTKIRSVTFPNTLETISQYAFAYTPNLISVGQFPASYKYTYGSWSPFFGAVLVPSFSVASENTDFKTINGVLFSKDGLSLREYPGGKTATSYRIPDSVTAVDGQAFVNSYLKTLTVPSTLQTFGYAYISLDYLVFEGNSSITAVEGFNWVQNFIYCGSANAAITARATNMNITVVCDASFYSSVPDAPVIGVATSTSSSTASISFTAPASNGGATITSYTATSTPGSLTGTVNQAGSGSITITGLTASTAYTFRVTATNSVGPSSNSSASASITMPASQAETTAAALAAQKAAEAKREAEKKAARTEISKGFSESKAPTIQQFAAAEISGVTEKNLPMISKELMAMTPADRSDIKMVEKVSMKYRILDAISQGDKFVTITANDLSSVGLIPKNYQTTVTNSLRSLPASQRDDYTKITAAINEELAVIRIRDERLASILALRKSRQVG